LLLRITLLRGTRRVTLRRATTVRVVVVHVGDLLSNCG
jgi:hypothetical protein